MRLSNPVTCAALAFSLATLGLCSQSIAPKDTRGSCKRFVQEFYDWYVPNALDMNLRSRASDYALKRRPGSFDSELARALRQDSEAQDRSAELVGLDFDPFLNAQDPRERYIVGNVTVRNNRYWVEVYAVTAGTRSKSVDVVPELVLRNGHWRFLNFHYGKTYPNGEDLLSLLKRLRLDRQRKAKPRPQSRTRRLPRVIAARVGVSGRGIHAMLTRDTTSGHGGHE